MGNLLPGITIKNDEADNPHMRNYSITEDLMPAGFSRFVVRPHVKIEQTPEFMRLNKKGQILVLDLAAIEGVTYIGVSEKSVTVEKRRNVKWTGLQPRILAAIGKCFDYPAASVSVTNSTDERNYQFGTLEDYLPKENRA